MSISSTIGQAAATNPTVGVAVAMTQMKSALLVGMQTGDTGLSSLLGALDSQSLTADTLLASVTPNLGRNLDVSA